MLAAMAHAHAARERRGDEPRKPRGAEGTASDGKAAYLVDVKSSGSQMKRPSAGASLSWRFASLHHTRKDSDTLRKALQLCIDS